MDTWMHTCALCPPTALTHTGGRKGMAIKYQRKRKGRGRKSSSIEVAKD